MKSIDEIFLPFEAEMIKNIPLTKTPTTDKLIWTGTKDGIFSVKSAYHLLAKECRQEAGSSSNGDGEKRF